MRGLFFVRATGVAFADGAGAPGVDAALQHARPACGPADWGVTDASVVSAAETPSRSRIRGGVSGWAPR
eukprot:9925469-Lingulodinium_polyedra.AAC.1